VRLAVKLALAMTALVAAVVVTAIWSIGVYLRRDVERQLAAQIEESSKELQRAQRDNLRLLVALNRGYADEPRTKAVINSSEVDDRTVADVARDIRETAGFDLMIIASPGGAVRANVTALGKPVLVPQGLIQPADAPGMRREFMASWPLENEVYLIAGNAVTLGERTAGIILAGWVFGSERAEEIRNRTKTEVVLLTNDRSRAQATLLTIAGQRYMVRTAPVEGLQEPRDMRPGQTYFVLLRSLDEALRSYYQLRGFLFKLGFFAIAVAILAALVLANTLSRRVARLASATTLVAGGDLDTNVPIGGRDEIGALGRAFNDMIARLRISREELRSKERLERELEIATVIQTLLLPAQPALDGFDVAARMVPAEEVGGDFYDLHSASAGHWIAIGDVSGHGVTPGLIMMMVQSMLSAIARQSPEIGQGYSPREVLRVITSRSWCIAARRIRSRPWPPMAPGWVCKTTSGPSSKSTSSSFAPAMRWCCTPMA
jgi:phosphoserine phosphatase RsbU/P